MLHTEQQAPDCPWWEAPGPSVSDRNLIIFRLSHASYPRTVTCLDWIKDPWAFSRSHLCVYIKLLHMQTWSNLLSLALDSEDRTVYNFFIWCIACLHIEGKPTVSGRRMRSRGTSFPRITKFSLIAHSCPSFCDPVDCSTPGFPVLHQFPELAQTPVHLILCRPLLLLLSVFPSIRVFSNVTFASGGQILELQQQRQPFQWKFRVDFL